jgi:hypothetical protein
MQRQLVFTTYISQSRISSGGSNSQILCIEAISLREGISCVSSSYRKPRTPEAEAGDFCLEASLGS